MSFAIGSSADHSLFNVGDVTLSAQIKVDLEGIDLQDNEIAELQELMKEQVSEFIKKKAPDQNMLIASLGPGWVGLQTKKRE